MKQKTGRKPAYEELQIKARFAALAPKAFAVLAEMLDSDFDDDRKWAVEQCAKGFARMIPTEVTGEGGKAIQVQWQQQSPFLTIHADGQNSSTSLSNAG